LAQGGWSRHPAQRASRPLIALAVVSGVRSRRTAFFRSTDDGAQAGRTNQITNRQSKRGVLHEPLRGAPDISRGIYPTKFCDRRTLPTQLGNDAGCPKIENKESNMLNKLLAAAAVAAIAYATCPANAAKVSAGCSGENLGKTESTVETMADGDAKIAAQKEISAAQDAMLAGKMGACAAHLGKAMHAVGAK
jgi:hypothetical protein